MSLFVKKIGRIVADQNVIKNMTSFLLLNPEISSPSTGKKIKIKKSDSYVSMND